VASTPEAVRAIGTQVKGFYDAIYEGEYRIYLGSMEEDFAIDEPLLGMELGNVQEIHIVPMPAGSKSGGVGKIIMGLAIVTIAIVMPFALGPVAGGIIGALGTSIIPGVLTFGNIAMFGAAMVLGGIAQMLAPQPDTGDYGDREKDEKNSFFFNGPVNTSEQGAPIYLPFGQIITGSHVGAAGITTEDLLTATQNSRRNTYFSGGGGKK
jgi:predicted phage tail protein